VPNAERLATIRHRTKRHSLDAIGHIIAGVATGFFQKAWIVPRCTVAKPKCRMNRPLVVNYERPVQERRSWRNGFLKGPMPCDDMGSPNDQLKRAGGRLVQRVSGSGILVADLPRAGACAVGPASWQESWTHDPSAACW
jgi:hypothetical protein